ncbi:MAG: S-methyl-5'-thioadenosine phosphorylase [Candidatus Aenigmatarchaeota archaeon]
MYMIGIIGGTGVYDPDILEDVKKVKIHTPYGATSDSIITGFMRGRQVAFLSRHGSNHTVPPHKINFRANIWALKELGVTRIIATCASGSLQDDYNPGEIILPDQFIDFGKSVETFYDEGRFYHVGMAEPFCPELRGTLIESAKNLGIQHHEKGTYLRISGPQFSTIAASNMYRKFADIIGMTGVPEAILSREKEICFAIIATITDYDVWIGKPTDFEEMKKVMAKNIQNTKKLLEETISNIPEERSCNCKDALKGAEA